MPLSPVTPQHSPLHPLSSHTYARTYNAPAAPHPSSARPYHCVVTCNDTCVPSSPPYSAHCAPPRRREQHPTISYQLQIYSNSLPLTSRRGHEPFKPLNLLLSPSHISKNAPFNARGREHEPAGPSVAKQAATIYTKNNDKKNKDRTDQQNDVELRTGKATF